jgi:hypothetical protein
MLALAIAFIAAILDTKTARALVSESAACQVIDGPPLAVPAITARVSTLRPPRVTVLSFRRRR